MNKEFIKKMVRVKKLEYDAIKELMPNFIKLRIESAQAEMIEIMKDIALEVISEERKDKKRDSDEKIIKKLDIQ